MLVWVDANQDGRAEDVEVRTLGKVGITSIALKPHPTGFDGTDTIESVVRNTTTFTRADGTSGTGYDVTLARQSLTGPGATADDASMIDPHAVGTLGQLKNDPLAIALSKGIKDRTLTEGEASALAEVDVSDAGGSISAADAHLWAAYLDPEKIAGRRAYEATGGIGDRNLAQIQAISAYPAGTDPLTGRGGDAAKVRLRAIVIDADEISPELVDPQTSSTSVDVKHDGAAEQIGWVGPSSAILAYDRNGDGKVNVASEVDFRADVPNSRTAVQGLAAFDSDDDGMLTTADAAFARFLLWRDLNGNGVSDQGEVQSLARVGIAQVSLDASEINSDRATDLSANEVLGKVSVTLADGTTAVGFDTALGFADATQDAMAPTAPASPNPTQDVAATALSSNVLGGSGDAANAQGSTPANNLAGSASSMQVGASRGSEDGPTGETVQSSGMQGEVAVRSWIDEAGSSSSASEDPGLRSESATIDPIFTPAAVSTVQDAATLQRQQLLRQSIAAFSSPSSGGSAAIWDRQLHLEALSGLAASPARGARLPAVAMTSLAA